MFTLNNIHIVGEILTDQNEEETQHYKTFEPKPAIGDRPEYFLGSIIEIDEGIDGIRNELRVYNESYHKPDLPLREDSLL